MKYTLLTDIELEMHRKNKTEQLMYWQKHDVSKFNAENNLMFLTSELEDILNEISNRRNNKIKKIIK